MTKNIKSIVACYVKKYRTADPFELADCLNIEYQIGPLGSCSGCYMYLKRHRCIFLNENLRDSERKLVMAHELGHALLHRTQNCYFIRNKTLLLTSKIENEANTFAAELLIPDTVIYENPGLTSGQLARLLGYSQDIMRFKKI